MPGVYLCKSDNTAWLLWLFAKQVVTGHQEVLLKERKKRTEKVESLSHNENFCDQQQHSVQHAATFDHKSRPAACQHDVTATSSLAIKGDCFGGIMAPLQTASLVGGSTGGTGS